MSPIYISMSLERHSTLKEGDQLLWEAMCALRGLSGSMPHEELASLIEEYFGVN